MYGSISRWRVKEGRQKELEELITETIGNQPPGGNMLHVFRSDSDAQDYWVVGIFDSREAYRANSELPDTDARYRQLREFMDSDPEWHDGEVVVST